MQQGHTSAVLDQMLEPVSRCFSFDVARALVELRADDQTLSRVAELADKCNEGRLTPQERHEYEAYVQASTLIGILQAKTRRVLGNAGPA